MIEVATGAALVSRMMARVLQSVGNDSDTHCLNVAVTDTTKSFGNAGRMASAILPASGDTITNFRQGDSPKAHKRRWYDARSCGLKLYPIVTTVSEFLSTASAFVERFLQAPRLVRYRRNDPILHVISANITDKWCEVRRDR
jgi:hypothetical protein